MRYDYTSEALYHNWRDAETNEQRVRQRKLLQARADCGHRQAIYFINLIKAKEKRVNAG